MTGLPVTLIVEQWAGHLTRANVQASFGWVRTWSNSIWSVLFYAYYLSFTVLAFYFLLRFRSETKDFNERKQAGLIFVTGLIAMVLGSATDVVLPLAGARVPQLAAAFSLIWAGGLYYSVTRYGMMRITPKAAADEIIATMRDSLLLLTPEGRIVSANQAARDLLEYSEAELVGKPAALLFTSPGLYEAALQQVRREGELKYIELTCRTSHGKEIPASISARVMRRGRNAGAGIVWVLRDISGRQEHEAALRRAYNELERMVRERTAELVAANQALQSSEERFRVMFERAPDGYYVNDLSGTLLNGNLAAEKLTGYARNELIGGSFLKLGLLSAAQIPRAAALLVRNALHQATGPDEFVLRRKDGSQVTVEILTHPVKLGGKPVVLGVARDISERKQAEERERQRLEEMSQLSQSALELTQSEPEIDAYQAIARRLHRFTGDALVVLSSTDSDSGTLTIRAVEGLGDRLKFVLKTLGRSPIGIELPYGPGRAQRSQVHLERRGTPSELAAGRLSTGVLRTFERILNLDSVYSMGIMYQGKEFGTVTVITRRGAELSNSDAIEAFVHQAAIALQRKLAEEREKERMEELTVLSQTAMELVQLEPATDVYQLIARRLHELAGASLVGVCSFDVASNSVEVRALEGLGSRLESAMGILGRHPVGMSVNLTPEQRALYAAEKLTRIAGRVSELSLGQIPVRVMQGFESLLNLGSVYAMAIYRHDVMLGTASVIMRKGEELKNPTVVDTFINQAAVALQRKLAEDELIRYREHLEELVAQRTQELTRAQAELVKREKQATLGQIAASMAHELRNPLGAMHNAVIYLNMAERAALSEKGLRHLGVIDGQIERSNRIITALLNFAESQPAAPRRIKFSAILEPVLAELHVPERIAVIKEIPAGLPLLFADPEQVKVALRNLIENALLAMPEGGRLTITAEPAANPEQVCLSIADTGCGIAPEHLPRLFEPLFSTRAVGVGLGLPITRKLVEANHGSIAVQSEPGRGAVFTVTLPTVSSK
jgi:PAS domain S-box-containing protein